MSLDSGTALNTRDFLEKIKAFLDSNGWDSSTKGKVVTAIGDTTGDIVWFSDGTNQTKDWVNSDKEMIYFRLWRSTDVVYYAVMKYFDVTTDTWYGRARSTSYLRLTVDDDASFDYWVFTDGTSTMDGTWVVIVTKVGVNYYIANFGLIQRAVPTSIMELSQSAPAGSTTLEFGTTPPSTWWAGKKLQVLGLNGDTLGELVEIASIGATNIDLVNPLANSYSVGDIVGEDPQPLIACYYGGIVEATTNYMTNDNGIWSSENGQPYYIYLLSPYNLTYADLSTRGNPSDYANQFEMIQLGVHDSSVETNKRHFVRGAIPHVFAVGDALASEDILKLDDGVTQYLVINPINAKRLAFGPIT